ncbi:MAG: TlpA family protein disulfide reductase [Balneolaceae bacterium]|nr:MAG: TlpA family protein disulfide reductase [Balneolaceae bacterium]
MKSILHPIFLVLIPLWMLTSCIGSGTELSNKHAQLVQNYEFKDWDGNTVSVNDFEGSIVVIDFWETWCGPCLSAFPGFQQALDEYPDDLVIIAATAGWQNDREDAVNFKDENDYGFIYVDGSELASVLGFRGIPYKIFLGRDGKVKSVQRGSGGSEREYRKLVQIVNNQ